MTSDVIEPPCAAIDPVTGAVCTRPPHAIDTTHWAEDRDWRIQWASFPTIITSP